jgi:hypothetical protein
MRLEGFSICVPLYTLAEPVRPGFAIGSPKQYWADEDFWRALSLRRELAGQQNLSSGGALLADLIQKRSIRGRSLKTGASRIFPMDFMPLHGTVSFLPV